MRGQALIDVFIAHGEVTENCSNEGYYEDIKFGPFKQESIGYWTLYEHTNTVSKYSILESKDTLTQKRLTGAGAGGCKEIWSKK